MSFQVKQSQFLKGPMRINTDKSIKSTSGNRLSSTSQAKLSEDEVSNDDNKTVVGKGKMLQGMTIHSNKSSIQDLY